MELKIAVKALIFKNDKFLMLLRSDQEMSDTEIEYATREDLPGGVIDNHELVVEGLKREIYEETGLSVDAVEIVKVMDYFYSDVHLVSLVFSCEYLGGTISLSAEHKGYEWVKKASDRMPEWLNDILHR